MLFGAASDASNGLDPSSLALWNISVTGDPQDIAHNLGSVLHTSADGQLRLSAVGGQFFAPFARSQKWKHARMDGLYLLEAERLADVVSGAWFAARSWGVTSSQWKKRRRARQRGVPAAISPGGLGEARLLLDGFHAGCVECRRPRMGACEFDGKNSVVHFRRRYRIYTRANLENYRGGRFVQSAQSDRDDPRGPFGPFELINIAGYDAWSGGNIYLAAVKPNPLDSDRTLLGLFPLALNDSDTHRSKMGVLGLSLSCDGLHWGPLVMLSRSRVTLNRTWDQPVDGLVVRGHEIFAFVHENVPQICRSNGGAVPTITPYRLRRAQLRRLTAAAHATLSGCDG